MRNGMRGASSASVEPTAGGQPRSELDAAGGPLPLLQFTATKLWEARDRGARLLTRDAYRALGGVAGARLLSIDTGGERGDKTVEITHESLIERWAKLRQWLDENEQDAQFLVQLRNAAQQWEKNGEAEGLLWRDRAALEAGQWLERRRAERGAQQINGLGKKELQYLEAVVALAQRTRRWKRRIAATVFTAISIIAIVVFVLAIRAREQAQRADQQAKQAQDEARHARNATRLAAARELQSDPTTVLALLREAEGPDVPRGWDELSRAALNAGIAQAVLTHIDVVRWAAFSPDGRRVVTACDDKTAHVFFADGTGEPLMLRGHDMALWSAAFSPDGKRIVTASQNKTARVWSADRADDPIVLRGHAALVRSAAFSPDGRRIVTASNDRTVRLWSADGTSEPVLLRGHNDRVCSAAFSPDGTRIVTASEDKTARVFRADGTGEPLILRGHQDLISSAVYSPDGTRIVTASYDKTARVWSADGVSNFSLLRGHNDFVVSAAYHPDGKRIVTASYDRTARIWNADGKGEPLILRGHDDRLWSVAYSPDGKHIVTASQDKTVRVGPFDPRLWNATTYCLPIVSACHGLLWTFRGLGHLVASRRPRRATG